MISQQIHINIGSNLGNRYAQIEQAVAALEAEFSTTAQVSTPYESEAWGYESANRFINVGVNLRVDGSLTPLEIWRRIDGVAKSLCGDSHRNDRGGYIDRRLDIDLIAVEDKVVETEELQLPHPRMHLRPFVLVPMAEIWPEWKSPKGL